MALPHNKDGAGDEGDWFTWGQRLTLHDGAVGAADVCKLQLPIVHVKPAMDGGNFPVIRQADAILEELLASAATHFGH